MASKNTYSVSVPKWNDAITTPIVFCNPPTLDIHYPIWYVCPNPMLRRVDLFMNIYPYMPWIPGALPMANCLNVCSVYWEVCQPDYIGSRDRVIYSGTCVRVCECACVCKNAHSFRMGTCVVRAQFCAKSTFVCESVFVCSVYVRAHFSSTRTHRCMHMIPYPIY